MGRDGHIASLYPGEATLDETERAGDRREARLEPYVDRFTLTLRCCAARIRCSSS